MHNEDVDARRPAAHPLAKAVEVSTPAGPVTIHPHDEFLITGRGRVVCLRIPDGVVINVNDTIQIDGIPHKVRGIEMVRYPIGPVPIISDNVGLIVSEIKSVDPVAPAR